MPRDGSGTYTAPSNSFNPAVEGSTIDEGDWNTTLQDIEDALTASATLTIAQTLTNKTLTAPKLTTTTVAGLPAGATGMLAFATNGRKNGEGAGNGTGVLVFFDGSNWIAVDTGATVSA